MICFMVEKTVKHERVEIGKAVDMPVNPEVCEMFYDGEQFVDVIWLE